MSGIFLENRYRYGIQVFKPGYFLDFLTLKIKVLD
jgi:hypothetical protein